MKILNKIETQRLIEKLYGKKVEFEEGVRRLKLANQVTVLNKGSRNKKWAICESAFKPKYVKKNK